MMPRRLHLTGQKKKDFCVLLRRDWGYLQGELTMSMCYMTRVERWSGSVDETGSQTEEL